MSDFPDVTIRCGDCVDIMGHDLPDESVDLIITSPPYWNQMPYAHWSTYRQYLYDVNRWVKECHRVLKPGRHCFWVIPDKIPWPPKENESSERLYLPVYSDTEWRASQAGFVCKFPIIWNKKHGTQRMLGSFPFPPTTIPTPTTERICIWRKTGKPDLSRKTKDSKYERMDWIQWALDVWAISPAHDADHPAVFPIEIPMRILTLWSFPGDLVLDPFCGSGTTGVACMRLLRRFFGIDIEASYAALADKRVRQAFDGTNLLR